MAMGKRREMEDLIAQLNERVAELTKKVEEYRGKEQAIVETLTEAQATAASRIAVAKEQARDVELAAAAHKAEQEAEGALALQAAREEAEALLTAARENAAKIEAGAQETAKARLLQAEAAVNEYNARLRTLNAALRTAAAQAQQYALAFAAAVDGEICPGDEIVAEAGQGLSALIKPLADPPADYDTPADLMHSIYQIQNRDIPDAAGEPDQAREPGAMGELAPDAAPLAPQTPMESPAGEEPGEERVWTVDEVMKGTSQAADRQAPPEAELDDLLQEIIKD